MQQTTGRARDVRRQGMCVRVDNRLRAKLLRGQNRKNAMSEITKCEKCGQGHSTLRTVPTPSGKLRLCWYCRREREIAYKEADSVKRNEANRAKQKLLKSRGRFCQQCGRYMTFVHAHHLLALRLGGTSEPENLLLLCEDCHRLEHSAGTRY